MMFKEYKSAEYWQKLRDTECARASLDNFSRAVATEAKRDSIAGAVIVAAMFALFPILYCIASILDG